LVKYFFQYEIISFFSLIKWIDTGIVFTTELTSSDLLDMIYWKKNKYNVSKVRHFLFKWNEKKVIFRFSDTLLSSHLFSMEEKLVNKKQIYLVSFTKGFFLCLLAQQIGINEGILSNWKCFSKMKEVLLKDVYQPLILTILTLAHNGDMDIERKNYAFLFFEIFLVIFKDSSSSSTLSKKKKEILSIFGFMNEFLIKHFVLIILIR